MTKQEFLAMSLPYGLKMCYTYENRIDIHTLLPMHFDCKCQLVNERGKPILRPLSDLTKEIEHKGERFIPIERLLEDITNAWRLCKLDYPNDSKGLYNDIISNIESCEFWLIQKLVEWRFDIADLISKGEAIDVNTLEANPYK